MVTKNVNSFSCYWTEDSPLLKLDLGLPPGFAFESRIPEDVLVDNSFVQRNINRVSEGQKKRRNKSYKTVQGGFC